MEAAGTPPPPPPDASKPRGRPIEVGRVISETFSIYGSNLGPLLGIGVLIAIVVGIAQGLLNDEGGVILSLLATALQLIATAIYTGFVVRLVQDVRDGRRDSTVGELVSSGMPVIGSLIVFGVLSGIAILIGFVLLIIPGLFLLTIWSVGSPAIVVENRGALEAFSRSHDLVRGQGWNVFGVIVCVFLILLVAMIIAAAIGAAIGGVVGAIISAAIVSLLYMPVQALVQSVLYFDLSGAEATPATDTQTVVEY